MEVKAGELKFKDEHIGYFILAEGTATTFAEHEGWSRAISALVLLGYRVSVHDVIDVARDTRLAGSL